MCTVYEVWSLSSCCLGCLYQEHQEAQKVAEEEREAAAVLAAQVAANTAAAAAAAAAAGEPVTAPSSPTRNTHKVRPSALSACLCQLTGTAMQ